MATNMDKALYQAPEGLGALPTDSDMPEFEIEMSDTSEPTIVHNPDGSVEISLSSTSSSLSAGPAIPFDANLAEHLDESVLTSLASDIVDLVESDINSRKEWVETYVRGLEVLGFKYEQRTEPWDDACGVYSTVLAEAAIRFQAESMSETFPAQGPVKTKILGESTKDKEKAAERVRADMNNQLTEVMVEYRPEHERMLYSLGLAGSAFKKVYFDPTLNRQTSIFLPAEDVIVPYGASHLESAERVTHVMRKTKNEMKRLMASGFYRDVDLGEPRHYRTDIEEKKAEEQGYSLVDDERYTTYEVHADLVIPGMDNDDTTTDTDTDISTATANEDEALPLPYVVTVDRATTQVLAIRRNWDQADPLKLKRNHFVHYVYVPGFGFYGLGLIHIIGGYAKAGTSIIRQLVDAGTLSNLPGGLKSRGLRIKGDDTPIAPGEWRDVDVPSGNVRDNIMPLPYKEPSQVLLALLDKITEEGRRLGAISDMNISDMSAQAPVGTTLALLERTLKPMAAVQARVHFAMKQEFKLLKAIVAEYAPTDYSYDTTATQPRARQQDYEMVDIIPVSDPNSSTMAQRVVQYQAVMQLAQGAPQLYDLQYLHRQMIEVLGVKNADKLVPMPEDQEPRDPISENMAVMIGKPVKAFMYQDHDAHIAAHMSFMQDPMIAATLGQNPMAQQMQSALMAHIAEHLGYSYRKQIEERLGAPLPPPNQPLPPEVEVQLSRLVADAGQQLTQMHQSQAAQQQAQQQAQDPMLQMQQQELQIKAQEVQRKAQKDAVEAQQHAQKIALENQRLALDLQKEGMRLQSQERQSTQKNKLDVLKTLTTKKEPTRG